MQLASKDLFRMKAWLSIITAGCWLVFAASLSFHSDLSRVWYVILPYIFFLLVLFRLTSICWKLVFGKQPFNRRRKEQLCQGFPVSFLLGICLNLITFVECIICSFRDQYNSVFDSVFLGAVLFLIILLLVGFNKTRRFQFSEQVNPFAKEWEE